MQYAAPYTTNSYIKASCPIAARPWIKARVTDHLFRCTPRSERVTIRVVSRFGETRTQQVDL